MTVSTTAAQIQKAKDLNNSRQLDIHKISDYPEVKSVVGHIFSGMETQGLTNKRYADTLKDHIRTIVLDLYAAYRSDPTMYISYSRNKNDYKKGSRYKALFWGYTNTIKVIDFLKDNGYIENHKGMYDRNNPVKSRQSRMKATGKFVQVVEKKNQVTWPMIQRNGNEETIILRDAEGKDTDYTDNDETIRMRKSLEEINDVLEKTPILLELTDSQFYRLNTRLRNDPQRQAVDYTSKKLKRVFNNGSFTQGGRFYGGWWQWVPRWYRKYITINFKDTVELDYSGLHINMMYAMEKYPLPKDDPYTLKGYGNIRDFLKKVLQSFINAPDRKTAKQAIQKAINFNEIAQPKSIKSIDDVLDEFEKKHAPIKKYFCSGKGIELQYQDSMMAERIMLHWARRGYTILPVHDSFITFTTLKGEVEDAMDIAFHDMFGVHSKIDLKATVREEQRKKSAQFRKERGITDPFHTDEECVHYLIQYRKYHELQAEFMKSHTLHQLTTYNILLTIISNLPSPYFPL